MPASKLLVIVFLFIIFATSPTVQEATTQTERIGFWFVPTLQSGLNPALQWLAANQSSDGSYGAFTQHWASAASLALWLNNSNSGKARLAYSWLASQLDNSSWLYWGIYGEADVPGAVLYSLALSSNLGLINTTFATTNLMHFQKPNGGFEGYWNGTQTVTSSVDTDMALLGLISARELSEQNEALDVGYLLSLQNKNGSFNLTSTTPFAGSYSLGPDATSITADTLLALKSAGFTSASPNVSKALDFLNGAVSMSFGGPGHVYAAATSALAFKAYDQPDSATAAIIYILSEQNSDGGFCDITRTSSYPLSNALDTGWAAIALETKSAEEGTLVLINSPPTATFSINPEKPTAGVAVHFDASGSRDLDGDQLSYAWTFGDGVSSEGVSPTHTYMTSGNFTVTLTVTDSGANPGPLSNTKSVNLSVQSSTVERSPGLPVAGSGAWIAGGIVLVAIIGVAFFLGRRSAGRRIAQGI